MIEPPLELHATLREVLAGLVPELADYGFIHMLGGEGAAREVAVRHRDAARESRLRRVLRRFRPGISGSGSLVARVLETGEPERIEGPAARRAFEEVADLDPEDLRLIREFLPRSYLVLPLEDDGRVFGTLSLARAETNLRFTDREIVLLGAAARQAALAIRNAFLLEGAVGAEARQGLVPTAPDRSGVGTAGAAATMHPDLASAVAAAIADLVADRLRNLKEDFVVAMVDRSSAGSTGSGYHQMVRGIDRARGALSTLATFGPRGRSDETVRLNAVVRSVADRLEKRARDTEVEFALDLDPNAGEIRGGATALGRALLALCDEVLDRAPEGARLRVRTSSVQIRSREGTGTSTPLRPGAYGCIDVDGDALRLDVDTPGRLLELFDPSADEPRGLGLLAAYGTARQSGGRLWIERRSDDAVRLRIALPAGEPGSVGTAGTVEAGAAAEADGADVREAADAEPGPDGTAADAGETATVLILERQESEREAAVRLLRDAGLRVLEAGSEAEARRLWETTEGEVDALIVDADGGRRIPDEGEPSLVDHLRMVRPDLPVLYSSRTPGMERALVRMSDRHTHFIGKPFARERLFATLERVLPERMLS